MSNKNSIPPQLPYQEKTARSAIEELIKRANAELDSKPKSFFSKINPFKKNNDVVEISYNYVPLEVKKGTTVDELLVQYSKGREELFLNLTSDVNNFNLKTREYAETESWAGMARDLAYIARQMSAFDIEFIPDEIKSKLKKSLEYSGILNNDPDVNVFKSHLGFIAQQVVTALDTNDRRTIALTYNDLAEMNQKSYNNIPTMVAASLNDLSDTCANFHASKIGPQRSEETKKFVETVARCAENIFNDDSMARGLKEKCIQRMCDTLKYAGFESDMPPLKQGEINQTNVIKFNIGQLLHFSNIKQYELAAHAPTMLRNYTKVPPELPKTLEVDTSFEKYIENAQSAKPAVQQPTLESTSLSV